MRSGSDAFEKYVLAVANRLVDVGNLHPDDAVELMDLYKRDVVRWEATRVSPARAAATLLARLSALMAIETSSPNPLSSGARTALGVAAVVSVGTALVLLWKAAHPPVAAAVPTPSFTSPVSVTT